MTVSLHRCLVPVSGLALVQPAHGASPQRWILAIELFGLQGGALIAAAFVMMCLLLLIYASIDRVRRRRGLTRLMPDLGFHFVDNPDPIELVPDDLFYPNGFASQEKEGGYASVLPRVPVAWSGRIGGRKSVVMEVSITRSHAFKTNKSINRTVIRCVPPGDAAPPDFMIHEWVLLKGQARGARAISGPARIGRHYYLFSDAPEAALVPWITTALRDQLARHRLWWIATHCGVFYLSRNTSRQQTSDMPGFLAEGEALLAALLGEPDGT